MSSAEQELRVHPEQQMLMPPKVSELPADLQQRVVELKVRMKQNPWYKTAGYHPDVHSVFVGFHPSNSYSRLNDVVPVYRLDHGMFAVDLHPDNITKGFSVTSWAATWESVYVE